MNIKNMPILERPRERLINYGASNLSDEELLAIILKTGYKNISAKNLASYILSFIKGIENLNNINYHKIKNIKGIGMDKACTLVALSEISKRINRKISTLNGVKLNSTLKVYEYYKYKISDCQEGFYAIYLDANKKVIEEKLIFIGTVNYSLVHPRDIFKEALILNASSIICVHNHPSGEVNPSKEDISITKQIKDAGDIIGIKLIDHVIVSKDKYYSFLENGKI